MDCLDFKVANFATEEFGKGYDAVVTSQCLHYNDQNDKRDIEQIVRNVNRSLRMGGHYLAVLVGGASKNSFTRPQDIEGFKTILSAYGFSIAEQSDQAVQNRGKISKYFFHYFHAVKTAEAGDSLVEFEVVPQVYAKMREKLTGGYKLENLVKEIRREDEEETYGS
jgi:SAM-dependent methyltransferase